MKLSIYENHRMDYSDIQMMNQDFDEFCIPQIKSDNLQKMICKIHPILQHYTILSCFFWLSCEGIYLIIIRMSNLAEKFEFKWFLMLSWGFSGILVFIWSYLVMKKSTCFSGSSEYNVR